MCLIIDANVAPRILLFADDPDFEPVHRRLFGSSGPSAKVVYGGKLTSELLKNHKIKSILRVLDGMGRARIVDEASVQKEVDSVLKTKLCRSDDEHIIGLARASGVRLLCSHDGDLLTDFGNKALIDKPRGKVYKNASHQHLLKVFCG